MDFQRLTGLLGQLFFDRTKIYCNNYNSYFIMKNLLINNVYHLGFHLEHDIFNNLEKKLFYINKNSNKKTKLKFVCNGGLNSISRKHIGIIYDSFLEILNGTKGLVVNGKGRVRLIPMKDSLLQ